MSNPPTSFAPSDTYESALERAADLFGVEREYWDIWGKHHDAPAETIASALRSMGIDAGSTQSLDGAVEARLADEWSLMTPATLVASVNDRSVPLRAPAELSGTVEIEVRWEDGGSDRGTAEVAGPPSSRFAIRGRSFAERAVKLPFEPRTGYHELTVLIPGGEPARTRWIVCPDRAYFPEHLDGQDRAGGIFVSVYALRSERNWGCGDFTDLARFVEWAAAELRVSFVGLNPLHALANRMPYNTSPYLPLCVFYKNPIYLDIESIEDFRLSPRAQRIVGSETIQAEIRALRAAEFVEYERVNRLKMRVLKVLFRRFLHEELRRDTARAAEFRRWVEEEGRPLDTYAVFCALDQTIHRANPDVWLWRDWPAEYRDPNSEGTRRFAQEHWRTVLFFKYVQWQLDLGLGAAQRRAKELGMPVGLYHDLALATDRYGADLWAHRRFYVEGCRVGAPPDDFAPNGQDWSFPPPDSRVHYDDGYRLFAQSIRHNIRHGGALRIDHVMRFFHLFWIPDELDAKRGIYVRDRHEDLIRILALESVRNQVIIVGEDLGTVADEIRETLGEFGMLSYRLFYFERHPDGRFKLPEEYTPQALVSASTHDLPTLAGFWENRDIDARRAAGIFPDDAGYYSQMYDRMSEKQRILDVLWRAGVLPEWHSRNAADIPELTGDLHYAIVRFLAKTPASLMLVSEEDLMKQKDQQNLPGTTAEYPNWRHKTRFTLEELRTAALARDFARMYRDCLLDSGRA